MRWDWFSMKYETQTRHKFKQLNESSRICLIYAQTIISDNDKLNILKMKLKYAVNLFWVKKRLLEHPLFKCESIELCWMHFKYIFYLRGIICNSGYKIYVKSTATNGLGQICSSVANTDGTEIHVNKHRTPFYTQTYSRTKAHFFHVC